MALAKELRSRGYTPWFLTRVDEPAVAARLRAGGFRASLLPRSADWSEGAEQACEQIRAGARVVVTDLPAPEDGRRREAYRGYLAQLKALGPLLVTFDDFNRMPFPFDIVINPSVGAERQAYPPASGTTFLLGPRYFPCPSGLAEVGQRRVVRDRATRVLVSMGGGDPLGLTAKVLRALRAIRATDSLDVVALLGLETSGLDGLGPALDGFPGRVEVIGALVEPAPYLDWADVAVTAGGVTKYETAATGLPSIMLAQVAHQEEEAGRFSGEGSAEYLGPGARVSEGEIAGAVGALLADHPRRLAMSLAGRRLVDGGGAARIVSNLRAMTGALR
jgi:hypothetical protein